MSSKEMQRALGWDRHLAQSPKEQQHLRSYISLQLASAGLLPPEESGTDHSLQAFSRGMLENLREKNRLLREHRTPIDDRVEKFLTRYLEDQQLERPIQLPDQSIVLDRHGMARQLSLPVGENHFQNDLVETHRLVNGVLNNPVADRRTTAGTFHVVEGGLGIAGDKRIVPKLAFVRLLRAAMQPPSEMMRLPYLSKSDSPAETWVSLLLRPLVKPEVAGVSLAKTMEVRFFVPGSLVSNLDFVESIFGNGGDPIIPENDAALDVMHWSGTTGCVILAPHLKNLTKKQLGLPHISQATDRQKHDRMCYENDDEAYNDGTAFKVTCRDETGVTVTLIADNYYGYCKKEVKTMLSYSANLIGNAEEEHAGGAMAFASYSLGEEFQVNSRRYNGQTFHMAAENNPDSIVVQPEGYGIDKNDESVIYIPEDARVTLAERCVKWDRDGTTHRIPLSPSNVYIAPSGYKIRLEKHPHAPSWRLVGTVGEGVLCHKPCTVSGGGKSEISKSLRDYMLSGPIFVVDAEEDFAAIQKIFDRDYQDRWCPNYADRPQYKDRSSRSLLGPERSLGSTIQLLTQSPDYTDEYNAWLDSIPEHIYAMALIIKRFTKPGQEDQWRQRFGVDIVNGSPGHELKIGDRALVGTYLRVGLDDGSWRTFKLRQDFIAAAKVQHEDDITASTVLPGHVLGELGPSLTDEHSYKFVKNCEYRLFQRPDDAVHRGLDKQTEWDLSQPDNFISNFHALDADEVESIVDDVIDFEEYTAPMQGLLAAAAEASEDRFVVSSAHPRRMGDGTCTKNPRYLQDRPDLVYSRDSYVALVGQRLARGLSSEQPLHVPVGAVLSGRRNNPIDRDAGIRPLAVYSPLHYQELPELMMDYISSLTGKSPSTTGAGSEGALTKGPFNNLLPTVDLNSCLVGHILSGLSGFSTPAGYVGSRFEVGHDISLLIPEVWSRMGSKERLPSSLIEDGMLEKIEDRQENGVVVPASRLGYRITQRFVRKYLGRVFDNPGKVFTD
ncbi:MAG: hypothetical protein AAFP90_11195, partial [Planctomycetota bacterium]